MKEIFNKSSNYSPAATGFLGKLMVEKLLRSCPEVEKVYILARAKKGKNVRECVNELIRVPAFDKLRESHADALEKIIAIEGDITKEKFGMSDADLKLLYDKVGVVIHSAATVRFTEPLRVATQINLLGTMEIMKMCHQMKKLEVKFEGGSCDLFSRFNFFISGNDLRVNRIHKC